MNDPAFHYSLTGLGLGQDPLGGGASVQTGDPTNSLSEVDPATGLINPATGEPGAPGDSGAGTVTFTGGGGGGGGGSPAASTTGTTASSILSTLTTGNTPLILGAIAVVGGIAAVAYLAHRKTVQGGGRSRSSGRRSSHRAYARRR